MSEEQIEIVRDTVSGVLVGKAADLRLLHKHAEPRRAIREVGALGRLALWLEQGQVVDGIRMRVKPELNVIDADGRPTGQLGLYAYWRNGTALATQEAFRVLKVKA